MIAVQSISVLHDLLEYPKPTHPLITCIAYDKIRPNPDRKHTPFKLNFYMISLKMNTDCELIYGRKTYDFHEGSLIFTAPGQTLAQGNSSTNDRPDGWMLCFHPDLIRNSSLEHRMSEFSFFDYEANEALHLSDQEMEVIQRLIHHIVIEYSGNLDTYSNDLIISHLEVLLGYARRFYGRQFITRSATVKDSVSKFNQLLRESCSATSVADSGMPSVKQLAKLMGYSPNYLSDMLKKETGKSAQEFIKLHILDMAKNMLLQTQMPIYMIADRLGFEQPSSFTKFIKLHLGMGPAEFRKTNGS